MQRIIALDQENQALRERIAEAQKAFGSIHKSFAPIKRKVFDIPEPKSNYEQPITNNQ